MQWNKLNYSHAWISSFTASASYEGPTHLHFVGIACNPQWFICTCGKWSILNHDHFYTSSLLKKKAYYFYTHGPNIPNVFSITIIPATKIQMFLCLSDEGLKHQTIEIQYFKELSELNRWGTLQPKFWNNDTSCFERSTISNYFHWETRISSNQPKTNAKSTLKFPLKRLNFTILIAPMQKNPHRKNGFHFTASPCTNSQF